MKPIINILLAITMILCIGCTSESGDSLSSYAEWSLNVWISEMQGMQQPSTKVSYSGDYNEHTEFETGDFFGLFVVDDQETPVVKHFKVYCSGLDNSGKTVWSIFKPGEGGTTSNYPIADIMAMGSQYFAYYPYNESYESGMTLDAIKSIVSDFGNSLPMDQSSSFTDFDLLVASNIPGAEFGDITVSGKSVSMTFAHTMSRIIFQIPSGAVKYDYLFSGTDFTPYLRISTPELDVYDFIFKPGCILDICLKYVWDNRLFKIETGNSKNIFPLTTVAGHCYYIDENAPKVPYSVAVDMGTSVMWSSFNLGAELDPSATIDNVSTIPGTIVMWGVNRDTGSYGSQAYSTYNNNFTDGTKPKELPAGYDFSGDKVYDAASNLWGGVWRTPTAVEWKELYDKCTYAVSNNTVTFTSTVTGNQIKIKFVGYYDSQNPSQTNIGYYWSSTSSATDIIKAQSTNIRSGSKPAIHVTASRYTGLPVRPVYSIE